MLQHGLWDPRFPLPTDPGANAFYYPTDGGNDDPTLLSSDEDASPAAGAHALVLGIILCYAVVLSGLVIVTIFPKQSVCIRSKDRHYHARVTPARSP